MNRRILWCGLAIMLLLVAVLLISEEGVEMEGQRDAAVREKERSRLLEAAGTLAADREKLAVFPDEELEQDNRMDGPLNPIDFPPGDYNTRGWPSRGGVFRIDGQR